MRVNAAFLERNRIPIEIETVEQSKQTRQGSKQANIMAIEQRPNAKIGGSAVPPSATTERARSYIQEVITELKKTTWPTRQEATNMTKVVISVIFVLGCYMGLLDFVLTLLVSKFSLIK